MSTTVILPDLLAPWPARRDRNPHYESVGYESAQWTERFHVLNPKAQATFNTHNFALLSALTYPYANREYMRLACDLLNWFFVYDAVTDVGRGASVREIASTVINIFKDPSAPLPAPSSLGDMTKCFWSRTVSFGTPCATQRLANSLKNYIEAVSVEVDDRERGCVRSIADFLALRRETAGVKCVLDLHLLQHDIPEAVMTHPSIQRLTDKTMDILVFINDVVSYNFERRIGQDGHNIISAVMKEKSLGVQGALDYTGNMCHESMRSLLKDIKAIPSFSPSIDQVLQEYIIGLNTWITGMHDWSFDSERYFGDKGQEVKRTRILELYMKPSEQAYRHIHRDERDNVMETSQEVKVAA